MTLSSLSEPRLGTGEAPAHLLGIAACRPAFLDPLVRVLLRDDIHELSATDVIADEMATRPDPLRVAIGLEHFRWHFARIEKRPPDHLARIGGIVSAIERLAHDGFHAVGPDQVLRLDASPVCEGQNDAIASLLQSCESMSEMNSAAIQPARESVQEVGAVKRIIRSAVLLRIFETIAEFEKFPCLHIARVNARRPISNSGNLVANPDRLQRLDRLRTRIYGGAYLAELRSSLENLGLYPESVKRVRGSQPCEPTADDRYSAAGHLSPPRNCS